MSESEAPVMPWEISLKNATWFIDDLPDGAKQLKLMPLTPLGDGRQAPVGFAIEVQFPAQVWAAFAADVTAGKKLPSKVVIPQPGQNGHLN
jgi:hypothetical protein